MEADSAGGAGSGGGQVAGGKPPGSSTTGNAINAPPRPPKPLTAGKARFTHGERTMKMYQVTEGEISELATLGRLATLLVALGTFLAGMTWDIGLTLNTADLEGAKAAFLAGMQLPSGIAAAACLFLAVGLIVWRIARTENIKSQTNFEVTK